jgi:hypothetical protein
MTEPRRWRDEGAPDEVRRMLAAARPTQRMPVEVQRRVRRRLGAALASSTGLLLVGWKSLALAATLGVASVATVVVVAKRIAERPASVQEVRSPPAARRAHPAHPVVAPPALELPAEPRSEAQPEVAHALEALPPAPATRAHLLTAPRAKRSNAGAPEAASSVDTLEAELDLLARARAALERDPRAALASLDEHARTFPGGKLGIERELLALDVLERLGRAADARARAERLLERARGSIYEARVRARLASP